MNNLSKLKEKIAYILIKNGYIRNIEDLDYYLNDNVNVIGFKIKKIK